MAGNRNSGKLNWEEARIKSRARYETTRKMRAGRLEGCRRSHRGSNAGAFEKRERFHSVHRIVRDDVVIPHNP